MYVHWPEPTSRGEITQAQVCNARGGQHTAGGPAARMGTVLRWKIIINNDKTATTTMVTISNNNIAVMIGRRTNVY